MTTQHVVMQACMRYAIGCILIGKKKQHREIRREMSVCVCEWGYFCVCICVCVCGGGVNISNTKEG